MAVSYSALFSVSGFQNQRRSTLVPRSFAWKPPFLLTCSFDSRSSSNIPLKSVSTSAPEPLKALGKQPLPTSSSSSSPSVSCLIAKYTRQEEFTKQLLKDGVEEQLNQLAEFETWQNFFESLIHEEKEDQSRPTYQDLRVAVFVNGLLQTFVPMMLRLREKARQDGQEASFLETFSPVIGWIKLLLTAYRQSQRS